MRPSRTIAALAAALGGIALTAHAAKASDGQSATPAVRSALAAIRRDADRLASGAATGGAVASSARDIVVRWSAIAPTLSGDGDVIVETKVANAAITAFDRDWQRGKNVRSEAKDVRDSIDDLEGAEQPRN